MVQKLQESEGKRGHKAQFIATHWSVVLAASQLHSPQATAALETLCRTYWYPVYSFIRRQGLEPEDAEDLTQAFFARLLQKDFLAAVDRSKGRFRSFLLAAIRHFLSNEWDKRKTLKRGGGVQIISLDREWAERRHCIEPQDNLTPDRLYDQNWLSVLLERVLTRLRNEYEAAGKAVLFEVLQAYLEGDRGQVPYAHVCRTLGMGESAVKMAVLRLRRRCGQLLRLEIAQTLSDPAEVEEEIGALFSVAG